MAVALEYGCRRSMLVDWGSHRGYGKFYRLLLIVGWVDNTYVVPNGC
jgi:hypothetical protein